MRRVVLLTHYFPPEVGAPQTRLATLARELAHRGLEVVVHTGFPHYPDGVVRRPYRNRPAAVEERDGVRVVRSAVYPAANRGFARRLADHAAFAASALAGAPLTGRADAVVVESPPLFLAGAAIPYAALKRAALVVNVSDLWPRSAVELGALSSPLAIRAAEALERRCYRAAAAITAPTQGIVQALAGVPEAAGKASWMPPGVDLARFDPAPPPEPPAGAPRPLRVLYAGTVGMAQGVRTLVEAARIAGPGHVHVTIAGDGAELPELRRALEAPGAPGNVTLLGGVEASAVPGLYAAADAGAVLLRDRPVFEAALPTKLFEVLAAGRPAVLSARGEAADLVARAGAGVVAPPEDPPALAAALVELAADRARVRDMGAAARRHAEERFGFAAATDRWLALLEQLGRGRSRG